jgi:hypothetical protein
VTDRPREGLPWYVLASTAAGLVVGLAITSFMVYLSVSYASRRSAYEAAKICSSAVATGRCRYQGSALVKSTHYANTDFIVDLTFTELPDKIQTAYFPQEQEPSLPAMEQGSQVVAELWQGEVTLVAGAKTLYNPSTLPTSGPPVAAFFGFVSLVLGVGLIYLVREDRRMRSVPPAS